MLVRQVVFHSLEGRFPVALRRTGRLASSVLWEAIDAFFVGGTTEWKMGAQAARCHHRKPRSAASGFTWGASTPTSADAMPAGSVVTPSMARSSRGFATPSSPAYLNSLRQEMIV